MKRFFLAIILLIFHVISDHAQTIVSEVSFTYDGTDFAFFETSPDINQADAQAQCINWGGNLATIKSDVEDSLLLYSSPDLDTIFTCHIGLNDIDSEAGTDGSAFVWIDGSTSSYRNWGNLTTESPVADDNFDCVRFGYRDNAGVLSQGWLNAPCNIIRNCYFCSKPGISNGCDLTYEGACYKVFTVSTPINWLDAQSSCAIWGGDLTSITTERENNYLNTLITSSVGNCWIGLNDRDVKGTYTWIDGTAVGYTNWTSTPSNVAISDCVRINNAGNGVWESVSCDTTLNAFLCKRDSSSNVTIDGRFGKLTDGGLNFEELIPNTFVFDSLTLACGGDDLYWLYSQNNTKPIITSVESATFNNTELRLSWLDINITKQGYYGCETFNEFHEEIGVFDPSLTTVAVLAVSGQFPTLSPSYSFTGTGLRTESGQSSAFTFEVSIDMDRRLQRLETATTSGVFVNFIEISSASDLATYTSVNGVCRDTTTYDPSNFYPIDINVWELYAAGTESPNGIYSFTLSNIIHRVVIEDELPTSFEYAFGDTVIELIVDNFNDTTPDFSTFCLPSGCSRNECNACYSGAAAVASSVLLVLSALLVYLMTAA